MELALAVLIIIILILVITYGMGKEYTEGNDGWARKTTLLEKLTSGSKRFISGLKFLIVAITIFAIVVTSVGWAVGTILKYFKVI